MFGSKSAPLNFSRFPAWCCAALAVAYGVPASHCVDDMISIERLSTIGSGRTSWLLFARLCGCLVSMEKSPPPSPTFTVIGVVLDVRNYPSGEIIIKVTQRRLEVLTETIINILKKDTLLSGEAASLSGKLGFTITVAFGRVGRARIRPTPQGVVAV